MLQKISLFFSLIVSIGALAQHPMHIRDLQPKIDSIELEANTLFAYEVCTKNALVSAKKRKLIYDNYLTYQNQDSTFILFLVGEKQCKSEYLFLNDYFKPKAKITRLRNLDSLELKLLSLKKNLVEKAKVLSNDSIKIIEDTELHTHLLTREKQYKLYFLTASSRDSIYPSGNDYLFIFNQDEELINQIYVPFHSYSIRHDDLGHDYQLKHISHSFSPNENLYPFAMRISKFRIYHQNINLSEFQASWDRRSLSYNSIENKVKVRLFYEEKMSPQYRNR